MFGYVRPEVSELRLREYDCYRSVYCGLCRSMGKCTGLCSRLSLSYDFVFLALFRLSLVGEEGTFRQFRCLLHPFKARTALVDSPTLALCADASALLTYGKCLDDVSDERGFHRLRGRLGSLLFSGAYRKAKRRHSELEQVQKERLSELSSWEKQSSGGADAPAGIFGSLLGQFCAEGLEGRLSRIASAFGNAIGRWLYLADAADDFYDDLKKKRFNPLLSVFGEHPTVDDWRELGFVLTAELTDAENAFLLIDRFPHPEYRELLSNILYLGLPQTASRILERNSSISAKEICHEQSL